MNNRLDQLLNEKARIDEEIKELASPWPKKITMFLHACKEENYDDAYKLGFSEGSVEERTFVGTLYEVKFDLIVREDGTSKIIRVTCEDEVLIPDDILSGI